ncbi:MAG: SDR family oxidoreductase, partial [Acidimicrobiaceae bacterium]|nr:SDR family oxidoreductase [Acidimicrobiaceae bacterium]
DVHVGGYVNVLAAALPIMAAAGRGRVVGFTSGVGLARTSEASPAYGTAKRAVAALTWQAGPLAPPGVAINALSPIAATRMVAQALAVGSGTSPRGLDLSAMPQPEDMAPAAVWLASDAPFRGQVVFSAGPELSLIAPPSLVEGVRTAGDFGAALDTLMPVVLGPAAVTQTTTGGSNPRFGPVWGPAAPPRAGSPEAHPGEFGAHGPRCLVVSDDRSVGSAISTGLTRWGASVVSSSLTAEDLPPAHDTVVVALCPRSTARESCEALIDEHRTVTERLLAHAGWARAASRLARDSARPVRIVHVVGATTAAGKTVAQAVTQLARSSPPSVPVASFAVGLESGRPEDLGALGELCGRLACADDAGGLAGAELAVLPGWAALRRHPGPAATVSFGGRDIPGWAAEAFMTG